MNCDCITQINEQLAEQNMELDVGTTTTFDGVLRIGTHWKDPSKKIRGKKLIAIRVTVCPFCGTKVAKEKVDTPAEMKVRSRQ